MVNEQSKFGGFLTDVGEAKQTNANALRTPWNITHMLLGDANGSDPVPDAKQTSLINRVYRAPVNQLSVDPDNPGILIAEMVLPPNVGGWWIRELGLEDGDGDFVAVANCAPSYKPLLAQGSGRNQVVRMHLILSNTANVQLKIDPSVVLATRQYVDMAIEAHAASRNHPAADTKNSGMMRFATLTESKKGLEQKAAETPAGARAQIDDHRSESRAHKASQIPLDDPISGSKTVNEYAQRLNAAGAVQAQSINGKDLNNLTDSMSFHHSYDDAPKNAPETGAGVGWIIALGNGDRVSQYWHRASAGAANSVYVRSITAGQKWSEWGRLYTSDNIAQLVRDLGFRSNHGRDGYSVFPDGTVHQWGATSSLPDFETVITTPIRWPNAGRSIVASDNNDSNPDSVGIGFRGNDQIVIQTNDSGLIYWFAVGY